jgi:hypothetical protein
MAVAAREVLAAIPRNRAKMPLANAILRIT